ncbi:Cadherin-related tumor suppressor [Trichinella pseudospiralis]|uniref:Cadherin-related tumor suppressor n=1 Tax=Trichinella pseudospiralis TaxID=6337 RepID=A0A0V1FVC5_TRIPS|nr:Cadherin-related tumor suppressor [Trichinella pseudospiralis]
MKFNCNEIQQSKRVNITITDENNTPPQLSEYFYKFHIAEDVPPGTEVGFIKAVDVDSNTKLLFSILDMENLFTIHPSLGMITTTSELDREEMPFHFFTVQISDGINVITAPVEVIVADVNDNAPVFQNETFIFHLPKSVQKEHIIGIIKATDNDAGNNGKITYHLQAPEPHLKSVLTLDSVNGFIGIKSTWNFDKIPLIHFKVCATDNGFPSLKSTAQVIIVFEEDKRMPVFKDSSYIISVQENVSVNTELLKLNLASDQENFFYYTILFGDPVNQFWISRKGILYVNKALDRETRHEHHLTVIAHDEVTLEKSHFTASATIKIILIDINDNAPIFTSSNMAILYDSSPVGTTVMTVKAIDPDEGLNGHVQYFIDSSSAGDFSLDPLYGTLRVNAMLNQKSYKLTIWAYDQGENQLKTSSDLNVVLLDTSVNHFILEADSTEITIFENAPVGKVLLNVKIKYEKDNHGESPLLWIEQSENSDDFLLSQNGQLTIARPLSYIRKSVYILKLYGKGTSHSKPSDDNISSLVVTIRLKDVNDNSPIFIQNPIYIDVVENTAMNDQFTIIGHIKAIDKDHFHNSQIFYSIVQGNTSIFQIDSASGELLMTGILDREECENYTLEIQAIDSGFPRLSSKATVFINVIDLNDNPPIFNQSYYRAYVSENQPSSTKVVQIYAADKDSGVNGLVKYKLIDNSVPFVINEETGWLSTTESLDRETQKQWNIWVLAEDCGLYNKHTSKVEIQITVNDENDNAPIFHNQQENIYVKNSLQSVDASDLDEGRNSFLKFYLNGKDANKFIINVSTGVIVSKADLKLWNSYRLTVEVSDHGFPEKQSFLSLQFITRPPSEFPVFQSDFPQVYSIAEDKRNTFVTLAVARSSKQAPFNRIRYSIASGNIGQAFTIDSESGELFTSENIDYETHCHYELWIAAVDNDSPPMISFLKLYINVEDVNDNSPVFSQSVYEVSIPEEEPEFFYVTKVTATDLDSKNNGVIEYSIDKNQSNVCDLFQIDPFSGIITTKVPLDRETKAQYHFVVVAKDQGKPALFGYAAVVVNLEDKNDNAPRFTHLFSAHVREDAPLGMFITQITAADLDEISDNTYILENGDDDTFRIEKDTGRIFVNKSLDRETISEYAIKVSVLDSFWKVMTSLTITVDDVNDNAPVFSKQSYNFYVPETKSIPVLIGQLEATDADYQENSRITYKMYSQSSQFSIDSVSGAIYSHKELVYYNTSELNIHRLKIIAHDSGRPVLSSITTVSVFVLPCDAKLINLQKPSKLIPVQIGTPVSTMIYQVQNKVKCAHCNLTEIRYSLKQEENWFEIDPKTGWIITNTTVAKDALDKKLSVKVAAEYETVIDEIEIGIIITDENRYSPRFLSSNYTTNILKNTSLNATIFTAVAQDNDSGLNGLIQYESVCADVAPCPFAIDSNSGAVKLITPLNLYDQDSYILKIKATDCAHHPKTSVASLTVITQGGYNRIPTFPHLKDDAFVHPSSGVNFTVYTFVVENAENLPSSQCEYKIMKGNEKQLFSLDTLSGQLVLVSPVGTEDYKSTTPLLVRCTNPSTSMFSEMTLYVHIGSVHENLKPTFARRVYKFYSHAVDSLTGFVKVQYQADNYQYFLGISGLKSNLEVDANSGAVIMKKQISSKMAVTVLSKRSQFKSALDFDVATLTVRPTDNGTFPSFDQTAYNVTIPESSAFGTKVIAPIISGPLGHYCRAIIVDGNAKNSFMVDRRAVITVKGELDYESQSVYELLLALVCLEEDQWLSTCQVRIDIADVNDNGPQLHESNRVGYVMENDPAGTHVLTLLPYDLDSSVNQGPFKFKMLHPDQLPFVLDPQSGILKTTRPLDREFQEEYVIAVSIADNGIPPKTTITSIKIVILDMNDMAPESEMLRVTMLSVQGARFYGVSADVHPLDMDLIGNYSCQPIRADHLLKVDAKCTLLIGSIPSDPVPVMMHLNGDDGKHLPVDFDLSIKFLTYTNYTAQNSVILHFDLMKQKLLDMAIQPLQQALENEGYSTWMTLYDSSHHIMPASELTASRIQLIWNRLKPKRDQVMLSHVQHGMCTANSCLNGGTCIEITESSGSFSYFREKENIFIFPRITKSYRCDCSSTYTGEFCETTVDRCAVNSCLNGGTCFHDELQLKTRCLCPEGYEGSRCENDVDECAISKPCQNNAHCENTDGSYRCICVAGYFGSKCEMPIDRCASNPCLNGGTCVADFDGYKCRCSYAYTGRNCEISSYGFQELSYIELSGMNVRKNELSFEFSTLRRNALLLYWSGTSYRSNLSYVVVDISNGQLRLACSASNGQKYSSTLPRNVTNARWHKLVLRHQLKSIGISISECGENKCISCDTGNPDCEITFTTCDSAAMFEDLDDSLFVGSVNLASRIQSVGYEIASPNFLGCIRDLSLNGAPLNAKSIRSQSNLLDHCPRQVADLCGHTDMCKTSEQCLDFWDRTECICRGNFISSSCEQAEQTYSLNNGFISYDIGPAVHVRGQFPTFDENAFETWAESELRLHHQNTLPALWLNILFRTTSRDGVLFFSSTGVQFSLIDIVDGFVRYISRTDDLRTVQLNLDEGPTVSDGNWHMVSLAKYPQEGLVEFRIDDHGKDAQLFTDLHDFYEQKLTSCSLGGSRNVLRIQGKQLTNFKGCIRRFILNGQLQPFEPNHRQSNFLTVRESQNVLFNTSCSNAGAQKTELEAKRQKPTLLIICITFSICLLLSSIGCYFFLLRRYRRSAKSKRIQQSVLDSRLGLLDIIRQADLNFGSIKDPDYITKRDRTLTRLSATCSRRNLCDSGISLDTSTLGQRNPTDTLPSHATIYHHYSRDLSPDGSLYI